MIYLDSTWYIVWGVVKREGRQHVYAELSPMSKSSTISRSPSYRKISYWLVVDLPLWKIWKSNLMIVPNIWKVIKLMFQTTNQMIYDPIEINQQASWPWPVPSDLRWAFRLSPTQLLTCRELIIFRDWMLYLMPRLCQITRSMMV